MPPFLNIATTSSLFFRVGIVIETLPHGKFTRVVLNPLGIQLNQVSTVSERNDCKGITKDLHRQTTFIYI